MSKDESKIWAALPSLERGRSMIPDEHYAVKSACEAYIAEDDAERMALFKGAIENLKGIDPTDGRVPDDPQDSHIHRIEL